MTKTLKPLLGAAFPPLTMPEAYLDDLIALQEVIDETIAPLAKEHDAEGRYPTKAIAAIKESGFLKTVADGGVNLPSRVSMEAQLRIAVADSAVAQIFKVHDEIVREIFTYCLEEMKPRLTRAIEEDDAIIGLAVAEAGKTVVDPMKTTAMKQADGGFIVHGQKIYTTAAAEADYIATWAFNPEAPGVAENPIAGMQLNLIKRDTPGVTVHRDWDVMGQRATDSGSITFDNVKTDPEWNATIPGKFSPDHASLRYQVGFCAIMTGIGIGALREAADFVPNKSRPWWSAGVDSAADDKLVRRQMGELTAALVGSYNAMLQAADMLDLYEAGKVSRTELAMAVYSAKIVSHKAALDACTQVFDLMGTRSVSSKNGFDRYWRNARVLSLHDPVNWKMEELGRHVLTGWEPEPGLYQ